MDYSLGIPDSPPSTGGCGACEGAGGLAVVAAFGMTATTDDTRTDGAGQGAQAVRESLPGQFEPDAGPPGWIVVPDDLTAQGADEADDEDIAAGRGGAGTSGGPESPMKAGTSVFEGDEGKVDLDLDRAQGITISGTLGMKALLLTEGADRAHEVNAPAFVIERIGS